GQAVRRSTRCAAALQARGSLYRYVGPHGKIVNQLVGVPAAPVAGSVAVPRQPTGRQLISEDQVKAAVCDYLAALGLRVQVRWGRDRGVDIAAQGPPRALDRRG